MKRAARRRKQELLKHLDGMIAAKDLPKFLSANPVMDHLEPAGPPQSGQAIRKLIELVEKTKQGEYS